MSFVVTGLVWRAYPGDGSALLVMLALADWCDDEGGRLFPSVRKVAQRIRTSESQARRVIHRLISEDWLSVVGNERGGAPGATRRYRLNVSKLEATARISASRQSSETPCINARNGSQRCAARGGASASQNVIRTIKDFEKERAKRRPATREQCATHLANIQEILRGASGEGVE